MKDQPKRKRIKKDEVPVEVKPPNLNKFLGLDKKDNKKDKKIAPPAFIIADHKHLDADTSAAIEHALKHYLPEAVESFKAQRMLEEDLKMLESVVGEYLKNFIVLGYDLSGEKIQILHATNSQEFDSLLEHARGSLLALLIKAQQNLPGSPLL